MVIKMLLKELTNREYAVRWSITALDVIEATWCLCFSFIILIYRGVTNTNSLHFFFNFLGLEYLFEGDIVGKVRILSVLKQHAEMHQVYSVFSAYLAAQQERNPRRNKKMEVPHCLYLK